MMDGGDLKPILIGSPAKSEYVCPKDFLLSWDSDVLELVKYKPQNETEMMNNIATAMSITEETVKELSEVCGKETLLTGREPTHKVNLYQLNEVPDGVNLECVKHQMEQKQLRRDNINYKLAFQRKVKYSFVDEFLGTVCTSAEPADIQYRVPTPNVVLTVQVTRCLMMGVVTNKLKERETYLVLGSQKLSELRDKIQCATDAMIPGDYSSYPEVDVDKLQKAGDIYKSSCFFIENVFYNDTRLSDNKDYSKPIIQWAKEHLPDQHMTTDNMQDTTFFDLKIRMGHNYLFLHQGNCEHAVLFTDMRLLNVDDIQDIRQYPIVAVTRISQRAMCQGCTKMSTKWVVRDSPLIPTDPCFLCAECFKLLLYTKDGKKVSNFKAHHFCSFYAPR